MAKKLVVWLIVLYQRTLSPDHGLLKFFYPAGVCRFTPSCSEYTKAAVMKYGVLRGISLGVKRVGRCRPGNPGGYDPIP